jgi:hypothetical protein
MTGAMLPLPLQFMAAWLAVWLGRVLQEQIDYLKAENQLLQEKLGTKRVRLTDAERRRLATLGKALGGKGLAAVATIASPETILRWYRELVAKKYDGSQQRGQGRPKTLAERGSRGPDGERECLGLHAYQGRADEPRP